MKSILQILMILPTFVIPMKLNAGEVRGAKILEIRQRATSIVIRFDKKFDIACSDGGKWAIFRGDVSPQMQQMWSLILSAAAADKSVTVLSDKCEYHNRISDVYVYY